MSGPRDPAVGAVLSSAGSHVPALLAAVEHQLEQVSADAGPVLGEHALATIRAGGKRLRPLLVIVVAGEPASAGREALVRAATAVELVHAATLVHDDVVDDAPLRRGVPTVYATAGRAAAIETGDYLFAAAFSLLARSDDIEQLRALSDAGSALARGELLQREDAWSAAISVDRYLLRCELKTARLFMAACALGELQRGGDPAALREFGRRIGLAFQLLDDVLDVEGPPERTGKHRGTDLLDGTVTLPLLLARARDPQLAALDPRTIDGPAAAERTCERIIASGATATARELALEHVAAAKAVVPREDPARAASLDLIADGVVARYT